MNNQKLQSNRIFDEQDHISIMWRMVAIVILSLWTIGCSTERHELLRSWARHDGKANLLVFVPGFISSKDEAWGSFIPLIKADKGFDEYDIFSYGYPQQLCFQKNDIRDVGAHLKSTLMTVTSDFSAYKKTIFVAHSMGGLVVLHSLLELKSTNVDLISNKRLVVMSLGTPYYGANMASLFGPYCPNLQGKEMQVLTKERGRLVADWLRSNKPGAKIPVYPFFGIKDDTVSSSSACGIDPANCESIDGEDHQSMSKPSSGEHLAYKKLQSIKDKLAIHTGRAGDHVSEIEAQLADVSDPDYRKLVAATIHAFDPKSDIAVGALVATPDGTRKIDVQVRSSNSRLTGIDIVDLPVGKKAGVEAVDAAHSKQADIKADAMIVCSNTGFDTLAIKKAKRMKIGLISVLRQGDQRIKALIEEVMYLRQVDLNPISITYTGDKEKPSIADLKYQGEPVDTWLVFRAIRFATFNPTVDEPVEDTLALKNPTEFYHGDKRVTLRSFSIKFHPHVKWFSQTVQLDATTGIYDYLNGKVLLPLDGQMNAYVVKGINLETATPLSSPPDMSDFKGGLIPGEVSMQMIFFKNVPLGSVKNYNPGRSAIDALVRPEDLPLGPPIRR